MAPTRLVLAVSLLAGAMQLSLAAVTLRASAFLPGLVAAGAFLASAFSRREEWIGRLYASDLIAAAVACLAAIGVRIVGRTGEWAVQKMWAVNGGAGIAASALRGSLQEAEES